MSSSGLIYAAIVGAWAAYLVPMWLRRQDELNEGRQTERFTTAIRILSRRGAIERRYARMIAEGKEITESSVAVPAKASGGSPGGVSGGVSGGGSGAGSGSVSGRAAPDPDVEGATGNASGPGADRPGSGRGDLGPPPGPPAGRRTGDASATDPAAPAPASARPAPAARPPARAARPGKPAAAPRRPTGRSAVLARRRRTVAGLFALFTLGAIAAGVFGLAWLWLPALPGIALSAYIAYLRKQERRRYEANLRRRLRSRVDPGAGGRERRPAAERPAPAGTATSRPARPARTAPARPEPRRRPASGAQNGPPAQDGGRGDGKGGARPGQGRPAAGASAPCVREEMDHAAWIAELAAGTRDRDAWDPVPVPLPTYVTAPVVPRGDDLEPPRPAADPVPDTPVPAPTPLFDQYADDGDPYEHEWPKAGNQ